MSRTVQELVDEIRQQVDEANTTDIGDSEILTVLNRAQRKAINIVARRYPDIFWNSTSISTTSGTSNYPIPAKAFGRRIMAVEATISGVPRKLTRVENSKKYLVKTAAGQTQYPRHYSLTKNEIELLPSPSGAIAVSIHYFEAPETLVLPQGRITTVSVASNYLLVDDLGDDLSTSTTGFGCYINVVDWQTGAIKGSYQIASIDTATKKITIKTTGLARSTVLDKTIDTTLSDEIDVDDYVCLVTGTCVPEFDEAYTDYYVSRSVLDIKRRFSEPSQEEFAAVKEDEEELRMMWANREKSRRVTKNNPHWNKL